MSPPKKMSLILVLKCFPCRELNPGHGGKERQILATRPHGILILIQTQVDVPKQEAGFLNVTKL